MANVSVTITQAGRCDQFGAPLVAGQVYSTDLDEARSLYMAGFASVADATIFDDDSLPGDTYPIKILKFPGFRPCLLPSLAANSTASRSNNVVTVSATGHGITTGATYVGYRFYYPGSASLAAGWYDSILTIPDANSLTFYAPGSDFGSQSINGAAAWTTATDVISTVIPGGFLRDGSKCTISMTRVGDTTATTKTVSATFGGTLFGTVAYGSTPQSESKIGFRAQGLAKQFGISGATEGGNAGTLLSLTRDITADQTLALRGTLSAASAFIAYLGVHLEVVI